ncbi:MAG: hypothetical protein WBE68_16490 [Candidatus Nitrosopolaris sp.]
MVLLEKAHKMLSGKYVQYQEICIGEYVIMIVPQKVITCSGNPHGQTLNSPNGQQCPGAQ